VELEDALRYDEPPAWHQSPRLSLGTALLALGKPIEAEGVFRAALKLTPESGWALYGLWKSLESRQPEEAEAVRKRFRKAWARADVELVAPRF
jgi:hypothetical protein